MQPEHAFIFPVTSQTSRHMDIALAATLRAFFLLACCCLRMALLGWKL